VNSQVLESDQPEKLIRLFDIETKRELEKYCREIFVHESDLVALILAGKAGVLDPYRYACHFDQKVGPHLNPSAEEISALNQNGVGPLKRKSKKAVSKVFQMLQERRCLAAHLFYTPSQTYWYLVYFDQRDTATKRNHWAHGSHIHLLTSHWPNLTLEAAWQQVLSGKLKVANKIHLRYLKHGSPVA
jgi:hypothetical protein